MTNKTRLVFFVGVERPDDAPIAPRIHEAFAALAKQDPKGELPRGEAFHHGDVTICWEPVEFK